MLNAFNENLIPRQFERQPKLPSTCVMKIKLGARLRTFLGKSPHEYTTCTQGVLTESGRLDPQGRPLWRRRFVNNFKVCVRSPVAPCMGMTATRSSYSIWASSTRSDEWISESSHKSLKDYIPVTKFRKFVVGPDPPTYTEFNETCDGLDFIDESSTRSDQPVYPELDEDYEGLDFMDEPSANSGNNKELTECTENSSPYTAHDQKSTEDDAIAFFDNFGADLAQESADRRGKATDLGFDRTKRALTTFFSTLKVDSLPSVTDQRKGGSRSPLIKRFFDTKNQLAPCCSRELHVPVSAEVQNLFAKKFISLLFNRDGVPMGYNEILDQISEEGGSPFQINYICKLAQRAFR